MICIPHQALQRLSHEGCDRWSM